MRIKTDYRFADSKPNEWSGVYGYNPDDPSIFEKFGEMFAVVRIKAQTDDVDLEKIAKMMIEELQLHFFSEEDLEDSLMKKLENSAWKMKAKMDFLLSREPEILEKGIDLEMGITVVKDKYLYCLVIGESQIFILRNEKLVEISKALVDSNSSGLFRSGSLEITDEDNIALATSVVGASEDKLSEALGDLNLDILKEESSRAGASIMLIADETKTWNYKQEESSYAKASEDENSDEEEIDNRKSTMENDDEFDLVEVDKENADDDQADSSHPISQSLDEKDHKTKVVSDGEEFYEEESDDDKENIAKSSKLANKFSSLKGAKNIVKREHLDKVKNITQGVGEKISGHFKDNQSTYASIVNKFVKAIKNLFRNLKMLFKTQVLGVGSKRLAADRQRLKRNRLIFAVLIIGCILFVFLSIRNLSNKKKENEAREADQETIAGFQDTLDSYTAQTNITTASSLQNRSQLITAYENLESEVRSYLSDSGSDDELNQLLTTIVSQKNILLLKESFTQPQIIADLGRQFTDSNLADIEYANGAIFIADEGRNAIYKTGTEINSTIDVHITSVVQPYILVKSVSNEVIFYDKGTDSSIGKFNPDSKDSATRFPGLVRSNVGNANESAIYDGNNGLYEVHTNNKQIFKREDEGGEYAGGGALYNSSNPPNWRTDDEFAKAIDIDAPFEIYVLIQGGGLRRYLGGEENTITQATYSNLLQSDFDAINNATAFDTSLQYLVIGDSANKRVLLFQIEDTPEKKLIFKKQFVYEGDQNIFSDIREVVINEAGKQIYVLDGTKVIRLDFND